MDMTLALMGNTLLRTAITRNLVSFPAQIRSFMKRSSGDLQERIVQLYFVRGWSVRSICDRYGLSKAMAHKLLAEWRIRAVESGFIQEIEPGNVARLVGGINAGINARVDAGGVQPGGPTYLPAAVDAPEAPRLREFDYLKAMPANRVPASISTADNPAALAAGSGV
jgi:transposase-like protein